ncbi:MAG TPA: hypothetical protein VGQ94_04770 [Terriglobales bacterium]|nr:hypothetical protein [Terriglobales bacterium]
MENYFNYFTEIEEHFQRRRGTALLLSTLDWALIETWKDAGIPLAAVLHGIDDAFERRAQRPSPRKVNSLAYCAQAVMTAAEEMKEAAVGVAPAGPTKESGPEPAEIAAYLLRNAAQLDEAKLPDAAQGIGRDAARTLLDLASALEESAARPPLEDLERRLTAMEEKLLAALVAASPDEELVRVRAEADHDIAPYRRKLSAAHIGQLHRQYVHKRLMERHALPRLSLFYM